MATTKSSSKPKSSTKKGEQPKLIPAEEVVGTNTTSEKLEETKTENPGSETDALAVAAQQLHDQQTSEVPAQESGNETGENAPAPVPGSFASMLGMANGTVPVPEVPQTNGETQGSTEKTGKKIEPNRPEQNGIKRPSAGSTCAIIWDTCDSITTEKGSACTSGELFTALNGYNEFTLRTQYARWRQFNNITGRLPGQTKAGVKVPAEFAEVKEQLLARIAEDKTEARESLQAVADANALVTWMAANFINF